MGKGRTRGGRGIVVKRGELGVVGVPMDGGENPEGESGKNEEREEDKERKISERARAIVVGDLDELVVVIDGSGGGRTEVVGS